MIHIMQHNDYMRKTLAFSHYLRIYHKNNIDKSFCFLYSSKEDM